jgi:hypothetical protein
MRIRMSDPALAADLLDFLQRSDCVAIQMGIDMFAVSIPKPLSYVAARLELELYLSDWRTWHSEVGTVVID